MLKKYCFLLLAALLVVSFVSADEYVFNDSLYQVESLTLDIVVSGEVDFSGDASEVSAQLWYVPMSARSQRIDSLEVFAESYRQVDDYFLLEWSNPSPPLSYEIHTQVTSSYDFVEVSEPISLGYTVPADKRQYLRSSQIIRVTDEIAATASSIIGDEQDAYRVAFLLGSWVKENIAYELNSVTAEASQTSQWVLENRYGVCDELTSLFISMLRSQGIPARFVSGLAYTNLEELDTHWGPHGWAEVWFPEVGWVPFDVTYGQFGWVDATHIPFQYSVDARTNAASYEARGFDVQVHPSSLSTDTRVVSSSGEVSSSLFGELSVAHESVGFGSYNRIDATLTNPNNYYVSVDAYLARTTRLEADRQSQPVLLAPGQDEVVSWFVKVDGDLQDDFLYRFPVSVFIGSSDVLSTEFVSSRTDRKYSLASLGFTQQEPISNVLECTYETEVFVGDNLVISCQRSFERVCIEDVCSQNQVTYETSFSEPGSYSFEASSGSSKRFLTVLVLDQPSISASLSGPSQILFSENLSLDVTLSVTSESTPRDIRATLSHPMYVQEFSVASLNRDRVFTLQVPMQYMLSGDNEFVLTTNYDTEDSFVVVVRAESFSDRFVLWRNSFAIWAKQLFNL